MERQVSDRSNRSRRTALYGMMIALALLFGYAESLVPISFAIPGIKLGLANLVTIVAVYTMGARAAAVIWLIGML